MPRCFRVHGPPLQASSADASALYEGLGVKAAAACPPATGDASVPPSHSITITFDRRAETCFIRSVLTQHTQHCSPQLTCLPQLRLPRHSNNRLLLTLTLHYGHSSSISVLPNPPQHPVSWTLSHPERQSADDLFFGGASSFALELDRQGRVVPSPTIDLLVKSVQHNYWSPCLSKHRHRRVESG